MLLITILLGAAAVGLLALLLKKAARPPDTGTAQRLDSFEKGLERTERAVRDEVARNREEQAKTAREQRLETAGSQKAFSETVTARLADMAAAQERQLETLSRKIAQLSEANEKRLEAVRQTVDGRLQNLQSDNAKQLGLMRQTVDEKLQGTLEKRLGESFRMVSDRLEQVHKGLGEMQSLASGVGDLKKVLSNVKTRGTWGEVQLGMLLEQV
ncbi:MAG: DNA recombination protein RmuC, partial [Kiritimatiellae bacterium]|nr:DNA recombination protein RmuC [Kiritimatiellia bacterium]